MRRVKGSIAVGDGTAPGQMADENGHGEPLKSPFIISAGLKSQARKRPCRGTVP